MAKMKTHEQFTKEVYELVGNKYEVIGKYNGTCTKIQFKHNCEICDYDVFYVTPNSFLRGQRCPKCAGNKKKNTEDFKKEIFNLVGNEYTLLGEYVNSCTKTKMRHNVCSHIYYVKPNGFLSGHRCSKCFGNEKKTTDQFKKEVFDITSDEYLVIGEYINSIIPIKIKHNKLGCMFEYMVIPNGFLRGTRCPKCAGNYHKTTNDFKQEVYNLVGNEYEVLGNYITSKKLIKMKHNLCDYEWDALPYNFLKEEVRCPKCNGTAKRTTEDFKKMVYELEGDDYQVLGEYVNTLTPISMTHVPCHHVYNVTPGNFISGKRCPKCKASKGEIEISKFLDCNNIKYQSQHKFEDCKDIDYLPFDFAVFDEHNNLKLLIEYDGIQHFEARDFAGKGKDWAEEYFKYIQKHDQMKNDYCKNNNIFLLRIPYWEKENIDSILRNVLI